jgi:hypothetical protein
MNRPSFATSASLILGLVATLFVGTAWGADAQQSAMAEQLFREGRELLQGGQVETALAKFEASQQLDPSLGTLLNLADCLEKLGRTASAWARFTEAEQTARLEKDRIRETAAGEHARALEAKLIRLRIVVDPLAPADLKVELDGKTLATALLGTAMPVDPGEHRVVGRAAGKRDWTNNLRLTIPGETAVITIAELLPEPAAAAAPAAAPPVQAEESKPAPTLSPTVDQSRPSLTESPMRAATSSSRPGLVTILCGAASVVALGLGTGYGIAAWRAWDDAKSEGCGNGTCPTSSAQSRSEAAGRRADVATIGFISGGVLAGAALVSYLLLDRPGNGARPEAGRVAVNATLTPSLAGGSLELAF